MPKGNLFERGCFIFAGSAKSPGHSGSEGGLNRSICNVDLFPNLSNTIIVILIQQPWLMLPKGMKSIWLKAAR